MHCVNGRFFLYNKGSQGKEYMFPDTRSTPTETRVLMGSIRLHWSVTWLCWLAVVLVSIIGLYSLVQMGRLGMMPSVAVGDLPALASFTSSYEPTPVSIPVTGWGGPSPVRPTFVDDFSLDTGDWSAVEGQVQLRDGTLKLAADWMGDGGTAIWNLPVDLIGSSFTYTADLSAQFPSWQRFGLAINLQPDGSGLLLMIEPDTGKAAAAWRFSQGVAYLVPWQRSPGLLPPPTANRVEVTCTPEMITLKINGVKAASLPPPLPCNQGTPGVFTLNPSLSISVENATLEVHKP